MTMPEAIIEATDVSRRYGERAALDGFSLSIPTGCVFGLLGPNGSGKSTFVAMVAAMSKPDEGTLRVFGQEPSAALRQRVGTVFQENAQDPLMTVGEHLQVAGRLFGVERGLAAERGAELLAAFGLEGRMGDAVSALSGGMRRRVEMARALLHGPELLLLDEPTTGVDPDERQSIWSGLMGSGQGSRTVVLATNDLAEADAVCDRVAFIREGHVVATGTPAELKQGLRRESLRVTWPEPTEDALAAIGMLPGVGTVTRDGETVHIPVDDASALAPRVLEVAGGGIRALTITTSSLEDAYFQHVGRRVRAGTEVRA
jgi:ABC-2 type transport system ATP-binding protein